MRSRSRSDATDYIHLLSSIFDFMWKTGMKTLEIKDQIATALERARSLGDAPATGSSESLPFLALVIEAWHRNRRYIDTSGSPIPVPLLGRSPSVESLIRAEHAHENPAALARKLRSLGLLMRCGKGRYKPVSRATLLAGVDPMVQEYVANSSATLIRTMKHNITCASPSARLFERFAEV